MTWQIYAEEFHDGAAKSLMSNQQVFDVLSTQYSLSFQPFDQQPAIQPALSVSCDGMSCRTYHRKQQILKWL